MNIIIFSLLIEKEIKYYIRFVSNYNKSNVSLSYLKQVLNQIINGKRVKLTQIQKFCIPMSATHQ